MKILMISLDKGLLGKGELGDVTSRHRQYGNFVDQLDIIVFSRRGYKKNKISERVFAYPTNSVSKFFYFFNACQIGKKLFKIQKYDLIVTQAPFVTGLAGYFLSRKFKTKLLVHYHGDYVKNKLWLKEKWYNFLLLQISGFISKRADGVRVMSRSIKDKLVESGIDGKKIRVISTPVSLVKFGNWDADFSRRLKEKYNQKKILLFVGRLSQEKDLLTLLKALLEVKETYPNFILLVIGEGNEKLSWMDWTEKNGLMSNVEFIGQLSHEDLVNYYAVSEFLVNSSTSESFGKIFVEAAACAKTSVATATTGAREIITDGKTGLLSPIKDSHALSLNILKLLRDEQTAKKMGEEARNSASKRFDGGVNTQEIINFWQDLVRDRF
ncbi:glycosyltransferase family 1 protein [Candidatus Parcubacteria bacterium]|nr:MAG: glycosyltransferase family 1 protein [Candidatus Parcubacteria bacterium]